MEASDLAQRLAALGLEVGPPGPPDAERKLPRIIKAGMIVRGGGVAEDKIPLEPPAPVYPEGYIPPEEAHLRSLAILEEAQQEAARLRQEALETGREAGLAEGLAEGHRAALESWAGLIAALKQQIEGVVSQREQMLAEAEPDLLRLVLLTASKVIQREVRQPDLPAEILRRTLSRASEGTVVRVRVNPSDHARLDAAGVVSPFPDKASYQLVADPAVGLGGCVVETTLCAIDATFRTLFEEVAQELVQEDPSGDPTIAGALSAFEEPR